MAQIAKADNAYGQRAGSATNGVDNQSIIVVSRRDDDGDILIRELQRTRARVLHVWPAPERLPTDGDVIYCDYSEHLPVMIPWMPGLPEAALVVILPAGAPVDLACLHSAAPHAVVHRPISREAVRVSLALAQSQFRYERRLRARIEKLDETLRMTRRVERAKHVLMATRNLSEEEAYHYMRRLAMERRVSIGAVATAIVDSQEILG